jgi:hypothetical protein
MVWLQKSDWEKTKADFKDGDYYQQDEEDIKDKKEKKKTAKKIIVKIDEDKIYDRLVQLTTWAGNEFGTSF